MKFNKFLSLIASHKRYALLTILGTLIVIIFVTPQLVHMVKANFGSWGDNSMISACENNRGAITLISPGDSCKTGETQVSWLKDIDAGAGLSIDRTSSNGAVLSLTNGSIGTSSLADGSVTPDKISNDASESSRLTTWSDDSNDYSFDATGGGSAFYARGSIDPSVSVTVPSGKAYYYLVQFDGAFQYKYSERTSSATSFFGAWSSDLLDGTTSISPTTIIVFTGYRTDWSNIGGSNYWYTPFHATWYVRLEGGTHALKMQVLGHSDGTMNYAHFDNLRLQVARMF